VDIADELQEVGFFFTDDRFISVLKEMAETVVSLVEVSGIAVSKRRMKVGNPSEQLRTSR
jgi:hypothetical protein